LSHRSDRFSIGPSQAMQRASRYSFAVSGLPSPKAVLSIRAIAASGSRFFQAPTSAATRFSLAGANQDRTLGEHLLQVVHRAGVLDRVPHARVGDRSLVTVDADVVAHEPGQFLQGIAERVFARGQAVLNLIDSVELEPRASRPNQRRWWRSRSARPRRLPQPAFPTRPPSAPRAKPATSATRRSALRLSPAAPSRRASRLRALRDDRRRSSPYFRAGYSCGAASARKRWPIQTVVRPGASPASRLSTEAE
jgi:hypothetical protein